MTEEIDDFSEIAKGLIKKREAALHIAGQCKQALINIGEWGPYQKKLKRPTRQRAPRTEPTPSQRERVERRDFLRTILADNPDLSVNDKGDRKTICELARDKIHGQYPWSITTCMRDLDLIAAEMKAVDEAPEEVDV